MIDLGANAFTVDYSSGSTSIKSLTSHASLNVSGGTLDFAESSVIAKVLTLNSTISGAGDVTVQGQFYNNSSVSRIAGSGRLILQGNSYFGTSPLFERSVINRGVLIQESNATLAAGVTFTNEAGATIDFHDGRFFGSGKVVNHGLFRKTTGASSRIDGMFTQSASGALDLQQGTFSFNGGDLAEGQFDGALGVKISAFTPPSPYGIPGADYGQLIVTGKVTLAGTLGIKLANDFTPVANQEYNSVPRRRSR